MPGALKDQLPNRALSGPELAEIAQKELKAMLDRDVAFGPNVGYEIAAFSIDAHFELGVPHPPHDLRSRTPQEQVKTLTGQFLRDLIVLEFGRMLSRDFAFQGSVAYRRSEFTLTVSVHVGNPFDPPVTNTSPKPEDIAFVTCTIQGEAPLRIVPARSAVIGLERKVKLENPNIDRINHDMPIIMQRSTPPQAMVPDSTLPGEPPTHLVNAAGVENLEFRYDKTKFESPEPPVDTDVSQTVAAKMGVPLQSGARG